MAIDAPTMLLLTLAIAVIASAFLAHEWRAIRDAALASWSVGFALIALGCALTPLRQVGFPIVGLWGANGLLIVAHLFLLGGMARYTQRGIAAAWWAVLLPWGAMLWVPLDAAHGGIFGVVNSLLVAVLTLRTAHLPLAAGAADVPARRIGRVFQVHGLFYLVKAALIFMPGAFVDITRLKGLLIQISLLEGILVEVLLALLMAAAVRRRREDKVQALAERDPLTGVLNRRAFREQALRRSGALGMLRQSGALMLIDVDHFKAVNDTAGHAAGDRLLVALADTLKARMPAGTLAARLGGDEFAVLAFDIDGADLVVLAQALRQDFAGAGAVFLPQGLSAGLSMGAVLLDGTQDLDALMGRADAALYDAKGQGRGRLVVAPATGTASGRPDLRLMAAVA